MIKSSWRLTWDPAGTPVVILAFGELLARQLEWPSAREAQVTPLAESGAPFLRDGGNVAITISFDKLGAELTRENVLKGVIRAAIGHTAFAKAPLKIEAEGVTDVYWLASAALMPDLSPRIEAARSAVGIRYSLILTGTAEVDS